MSPLPCLFEVLFCFDESTLPFSLSPVFQLLYAVWALTTVHFCLRRCLGNVWWRASFLKATSAMTLTCHPHCSCRGGFSSRIRSWKHTRLRWTYSSRRWSNLSHFKWINLDFLCTTISMALDHLCDCSRAVRRWRFLPPFKKQSALEYTRLIGGGGQVQSSRDRFKTGFVSYQTTIFTWGPTLLDETFFCLVGRKTQLESAFEDWIWPTLPDGNINISFNHTLFLKNKIIGPHHLIAGSPACPHAGPG